MDTLTIVYIFDRNAANKEAIDETVSICLKMQKANGVEIKIAVMTYGNKASWMTKNAVNLDELEWSETSCDNLCNFGSALKLLNESLDNLLGKYEERRQTYKPIIILCSCSGSTDDYKINLNALNENIWFRKSVRIAFGLGENYDRTMLADFTGTEEAVIDSTDLSSFGKLFGFYRIYANETENKKTCNGVEKCRMLKKLRKQIAEDYGIDYEPALCDEPDNCGGTCPACEAELEYLNRQIEMKKHPISCEQSENRDFCLMGRIAWYPDETIDDEGGW